MSICSVLRPGGFFIFNLNLVEKLPASTTPEISWLETEEFTLIWESFLEPEKKIWQIKLTAFILEENGLYTKIQEEHKERSYSLQEIEPLLARAGWELKSCYKALPWKNHQRKTKHILHRPPKGLKITFAVSNDRNNIETGISKWCRGNGCQGCRGMVSRVVSRDGSLSPWLRCQGNGSLSPWLTTFSNRPQRCLGDREPSPDTFSNRPQRCLGDREPSPDTTPDTRSFCYPLAFSFGALS